MRTNYSQANKSQTTLEAKRAATEEAYEAEKALRAAEMARLIEDARIAREKSARQDRRKVQQEQLLGDSSEQEQINHFALMSEIDPDSHESDAFHFLSYGDKIFQILMFSSSMEGLKVDKLIALKNGKKKGKESMFSKVIGEIERTGDENGHPIYQINHILGQIIVQ
ncbi:MAG: hypothetical protein WC774_03945 [Candidatus Gracilibacteria bacterium]